MKSFACPFCRYDHHDPSTLVQHINSYHVKPAEQPIEGGPAQASHRTLSTGTHDRRRSYSGSSALDSRPSDSSSYSGKGSSHYRPRHRHQEYAYEHEHGHERPVGDLPLQHSQSSHTAPVRSNSRGPDAPRRRGSSRRLRSVTTTDIAAPSVIFKGFFNACRNSVGHSSKPVLDEKRPIERQVSPRYVQPQERQIINEPLRTTDLGPHANEKKMPRSLYRQLKAGPRVAQITRTRTDGRLERFEVIENETPRIIPLLERFSTLDPDVAQAVYCAPHIRHVFKLENEGGFCGYRNIQMLISHIQGSSLRGLSHFPNRRLPTILDLQNMIEEAWDRGFNSIGRSDTGGIRGTRKYIGTSEAQALFQSKGINCEPEVFFSSETCPAHETLISRIWEYFLSPGAEVTESKVITTKMAPMYLQHQGHSMTVVGIEKHNDGNDHLVVLDPGMKTIPEVRALVDRNVVQCGKAGRYMQTYRKGREYLSMYDAFEVLRLDL